MPLRSLLRRVSASAFLLLLAGCDSPSQSNPPPQPPPIVEPETPPEVVWLKANAHPIRSLSVSDRDFSDLQALKAAIGDAQVVLLGEQSHGDGTTFHAKARLVAFLHQEMGFDVLAWESGMWEMAHVWRQVQAGADVLTASRRGIFGIWSRSEQVLPVLDYVASTTGTARPLELAGFDSQLTGTLAGDSLHILTERFAESIGSDVPQDPDWAVVKRMLRDLGADLHFGSKPSPADQARALRLMAALREDAAAVAEGSREALFWAQALASMASYANALWTAPPNQTTVAMSNERDAQMGRNLVWMANVYYPGRKIIGWAASSHIGRDMGHLRTVDGQQLYQTGWTAHMGGEAHTVLGQRMYTIGFTAGAGTWGRWGLPPTTLETPMAGSLEAFLGQAALANAFVDFQDLPAGAEWLRALWARPLGYTYMRGDWTRVFDGMIWTQTMTPSTPATR